jgi:ketosteroid isomerase-like protein
MPGETYARRRISFGPTRGRRSLDQRVAARMPRLYRAPATWVRRLSPQSSLRVIAVDQAVRSGFDAYNRRDWDVVLAAYDPQVEIRLHHVQDIEGVYDGHDGWRHYWRLWFDSWDESQMEPQEIVDFPDRTLILGWTRCRAAASGLELEQQTAWLMTWGDGMTIARHEEWWDHAAGLDAVGLKD